MHFGQLQFSRMISFSFITLLPLSVLVLKLDHNSRDIFGYYVLSVQLIFFFIQKFDPYLVEFVKPLKESSIFSYLCMKYVDPFSNWNTLFNFLINPAPQQSDYSFGGCTSIHAYTDFLFIWRLVLLIRLNFSIHFVLTSQLTASIPILVYLQRRYSSLWNLSF